MSKNNIDKQIREKLAQHEVSPNPAVWEAVRGQIASSAKRQYGWLAGIFFVLLTVGAFYFLSRESDSGSETTQTSELSTIKSSDAVSSSDLSKRKNSSTAANTAQGGTREVALPAAASDKSKGTSTSNQTQIKGALTNSKSHAENRNYLEGEKSAARNFNTDLGTPQTESLASKAPATMSAQKEAGSDGISLDGKKSPDLRSTQDTEEKANNFTTVEGESNSWVQKALEKPAVSLSDISSADSYSPVRTTAFLTLEQKQKKALSSFDLCEVLFPSIEDCPEFGDSRRRYQIDAYTQTGILFSHLTNNDLNAEVNSYLNQRRSTETPQWYLGFGVRLSTQWTSGISLRGGLQVSQSQIRVDYRDETQRQTTVNVSIDTLVDENGNTTVVWDTISIIETGVQDRRAHNTFTQIDIPLTVGYTFFGPRYDVEVNAGVMVNMLFQRSGRVFAPDGEFYELGRSGAPAGTQPYETDLGLSVITSVALNYRISPQFSLFAEPQLRYFLDPVSPGDYALQENWFMGSLMLGGRYAF